MTTAATSSGRPNRPSGSSSFQVKMRKGHNQEGRAELLLGELAEQPEERVVAIVHDALLQRDDGVVGDPDLLGADLGTALGNVAVANSGFRPHHLRARVGVQRVHLQRRKSNKEAWPGEVRLVLFVVADDVTHILTEKALDALMELLDVVDVRLHHPVGTIRIRWARPEGRYRLGDLVVKGEITHQVPDDRKGLHGGDGNRFTGRKQAHLGHAHESWPTVDLDAARAALTGLAVPSDRQVGRLRRLQAVDHIEQHHPLLGLNPVLRVTSGPRVAPEKPQRDDRHYPFSLIIRLSSSGISMIGLRAVMIVASRLHTTMFTEAKRGSVDG